MARRRVTTRTVTRYRRSFRSRGNGGGRKVSLAVIGGMIPGIAFAAEPVQSGRTWDETWQRLIAAYTGYSYGEKRWSAFYLGKGLFPMLGGMFAHGLANYVGLNRAIARFRLPVEI